MIYEEALQGKEQDSLRIELNVGNFNHIGQDHLS